MGKCFRLANNVYSMLRYCKMQVYESFRSENILFFGSRKNDTNAGTETDVSGNVDLTQSWVFDFELCRPDSFFSAIYRLLS